MLSVVVEATKLVMLDDGEALLTAALDTLDEIAMMVPELDSVVVVEVLVVLVTTKFGALEEATLTVPELVEIEAEVLVLMPPVISDKTDVEIGPVVVALAVAVAVAPALR